MARIELTAYRDCEAALKEPQLKQALYDEGAIVMDRVLVTLHGEEHRTRRLAEMGVFRRDFFRRYEQEVIPGVFTEVMAVTDQSGDVDLVDLGYRFMVYLAVNFAGIDLADRSRAEFDDLVRMLRTFGVAATLGQSNIDREAAKGEIRATLEEFDRRFFTPSARRRRALIERVERGELAADDLPMDVLTVLLRKADELAMVRDMMLRETAFYFLASAHTSVHSLSHAVHHLLDWCEGVTDGRAQLLQDPERLQRFVHESFRLHPSSPVALRRALAPVAFLNGANAAPGDTVVIHLREANRDTGVFGADAAEFNPDRAVPAGVPETGITFGIGMHSCLGKNLAAGALPPPGREVAPERRQLGTVAWIARALLDSGVTRDADRPGQLDATIERETWQRYPVQFAAAAR
jgi:cytochrome P450